jgi:hypothetical protein
MSEFNPAELKYYAIIFGVILLILFTYRKAVKKVRNDQEKKIKAQSGYKVPVVVEKPAMTEEQFNRSWKSLSYLLLLAGAGNLYSAYNAVTKATQSGGLWVWWVDFAFSIVAAVAAVLIWRKKTKNWVFAYFAATLVPIFLFMSIQGQPFKISALVHLFPLVLLYFVLKPVWGYLKTS